MSISFCYSLISELHSVLASEVNCDWRTTNNGPPPLLPATRARESSCVIPRVKSSGLTSFLYQGVCHWNNLPLEIKQCPLKTLLNIKSSVFYIVVSLYRKAVYRPLRTFLILTIGCFLHFFLHILSDDCNKYYVPCYFQ